MANRFSPEISLGSNTLRSGDGVDPRKTPEWYLQVVEKCSRKAQDIFSPGGSNTSPKFNYEQCKYLADKLASALTEVDSFLRIFRVKCGDADMAEHLDIFKFFLSLAFEVEAFIQGCCKDAWIQAAFTLANMFEHVTLLGFNLELFRLVFLFTKDDWRATQERTAHEVAQFFKVEVKTGKKGSARDMETLLKKLEDAKMSPPGTLSREDVHLATILLERLNRGTSIAQGSNNEESSSEVPTGWQPSETSRSDVGGSSQIFNDLEQKKSLGNGASGHVYEATLFGAQVAEKRFIGSDHPDFTNEVSFLKRLSHSNVMSLFCHGKNHRKCSIVMELMEGDLLTLMGERLKGDGSDESPPFTIFEAIDLMFQIAAGMNYLYENRVVHMDLKSGNVFFKRVKEPESNIEYVRVKVGDFGLSKTKERSRTYSEQQPNTGTTRWMAPELMPENLGLFTWILSLLRIRTPKSPFKSDVYSFAMVCFEILSGYVPFQTINRQKDIRDQVVAGRRPELSSRQCPDELKTLIESCWDGEPTKRPSFMEICAKLKYSKYHSLTRVKAVVVNAWFVDEGSVQDILKTVELAELDHDYARDTQIRDSYSSIREFNVFLSHAGAQKAFVQQLSEDLEMVDRYPFFDRFWSSGPIGVNFPAFILEAVSQTRVAVVVLSEEFLSRSKWTMLELLTMVRISKENPKYRILPIFWGISPHEIKDPENHKRWLLAWAEWAKADERIILKEWMFSLHEVCMRRGLVYDRSRISETELRSEIVQLICKLVPPSRLRTV